MKELAAKHKRYSCRRLHEYLKREGLVINKKRTERIYLEEKLKIRVRRRNKLAPATRIQIPKAEKPNQLWAMDFLHDALHNGRRFRAVPIIDTFTREILWIEVDTSVTF